MKNYSYNKIKEILDNMPITFLIGITIHIAKLIHEKKVFINSKTEKTFFKDLFGKINE